MEGSLFCRARRACSRRAGPPMDATLRRCQRTQRVMLFDFNTGKWQELGQGSFGWLNWSRDGKYIYFLDQSGKGGVLRIKIGDPRPEPVVALDNFKTTGR